MEKLCEEELGVEYDSRNPFKTVTNVISRLSETSEPDVVTLILIDEVPPCGSNQKDPDWSQLQVKPNVIFLLAISPIAEHATSTKLIPPPPENNAPLLFDADAICSEWQYLTRK